MFEIGNDGRSRWNSHPKASFYKWREGPHVETAQTALTVILKLVISGLICVILIVLDCFSLSSVPESVVPISLRQILEIAAVYVMATVKSSCSST